MTEKKCMVMWRSGDGWHQCLKLKGHDGIHEKIGKHPSKPGKGDALYIKVSGVKPGTDCLKEYTE